MNTRSHPITRALVIGLLLLVSLGVSTGRAVDVDNNEPEFTYPEGSPVKLLSSDDGTLYGTKQSAVFAIDSATGEVSWRYTGLRTSIELERVGGALHAFSLDETHGELVDLDPENGVERWRYGGLPVDDIWALFVTADAGGLVVIDAWGEFGSILVGLDAQTGSIRWLQNFMNCATPSGDVIAIMSRPGPVTDGHLPAAGVWSNYRDTRGVLFSLDADSGWPAWVTYPSQLAFVVDAAGQTLLVLVADDRDDASFVQLQGVASTSGETIWSTDLPAPALKASAAGDRVAVVTADQSLLLIDSTTGEIVWSRRLEAGITSLGLDGQRVYTAEPGDLVVARDLATGDEVWSGADSGRAIATVDGSQDVLIVERAGAFTRLDPRTGEMIWTSTPLYAETREVPAAAPVAAVNTLSRFSVDGIRSDGPLVALTGKVLPGLSADDSAATDINASGQISGSAENRSHADHAVLWTDGVLLDLGVLPGGRESGAVALNDAGHVVGWSETGAGEQHAVRWIDSVVEDIHPSAYVNSTAYDINAAGQIAGIGYDGEGMPQAWLWDEGDWKQLPDLGGGYAAAFAISDNGLVAGLAGTESGAARAVIWDGDDIRELETPEGAQSAASAINRSGDVAGFIIDAGGHRHAVVWQDGQMIELAAPAGAAAAAAAISDDGSVVGYVHPEIGSQRAALWRLDAPGTVQVLGITGGKAVAVGDGTRIVGSLNDTAIVWEPVDS